MAESKREDNDEMRLIDILYMIWKWKYLIISGSLAFGFIAGIFGYIAWKNTPQSFKTTMVLKPGVRSIDTKGVEQYIDSLENIKTFIEGELKYKLLSKTEEKDELTSIIPIDLYATIQNNLNIIEVSCLSNPPEVGAMILNRLIHLITDRYIEKEKSIRNELSVINKSKINEKKEMFEMIASNNTLLERQLTLISNKLENLNSKLRELKTQHKQLLQHEKILSQQNDLSSSLSYFTIIQKNMDFENQIRENIYRCLIEKEDIWFRLKKNTSAAEKLHQEIGKLQDGTVDHGILSAKRGNDTSIVIIKNEPLKDDPGVIRVIQAPTSQPIDKENKVKLTVLLAFITGFFFWFFLVLLIEYIRKYRQSVHQSSI